MSIREFTELTVSLTLEISALNSFSMFTDKPVVDIVSGSSDTSLAHVLLALRDLLVVFLRLPVCLPDDFSFLLSERDGVALGEFASSLAELMAVMKASAMLTMKSVYLKNLKLNYENTRYINQKSYISERKK